MTTRHHTMDSLGEWLLALYQNARHTEPDIFQRQTLAQLKTFIEFDFAAWGGGLAATRTIAQVTVLNQSPGLFAEWQQVAHQDAYCELALQRLNHAVMFDDVPGFRQSAAYLNHWQRYDARQMLATIRAEPVSGYVSFIGLCHADRAHVYDEQDRQHKDLLMPHLATALQLSHDHLMQSAGGVDEAVALVSLDGSILTCQPGFLALIHEEWGPSANRLPREAFHCAIASARWRGRRIQLQSNTLADYQLVRAQPADNIQSLTQRELEIAALYAQGLSHKQIARDLQIAPATVRNHIARVYQRLNVANKSELARLIQ